ncbi:hypothetical protein Tco_0183863 [Tanacetum coccineum]
MRYSWPWCCHDCADSPTHQSPGYIPESDPEEDLEEDDEEDPEEDPADYPADRGDDDDEHLAPADACSSGTARRVGPTTARADLYGFADTLEAAPGRRMSRELGYGIRITWDDPCWETIQEIAPDPLEGGQHQRVH